MNVLSLPLLQKSDLAHAHLLLSIQDASNVFVKDTDILATDVNAFKQEAS